MCTNFTRHLLKFGGQSGRLPGFARSDGPEAESSVLTAAKGLGAPDTGGGVSERKRGSGRENVDLLERAAGPRRSSEGSELESSG